MSEAQRRAKRKYKRWLEQRRDDLRCALRDLRKEASVSIGQNIIMLLTLESRRFKSLRQTLNNMPPGSIQKLKIDVSPSYKNDDCRNPPSNEALLATATELAHMVGSMENVTVKSIRLVQATASVTSSFLAACSRLESAELIECPLVTATVQSMFAIKTLRRLNIEYLEFSDPESINAFCAGIEECSLKELSLFEVSFGPEHVANVAKALAGSKTLVRFDYLTDERSFQDSYCSALLHNDNIKLERLHLSELYIGEARDDNASAGGDDDALVTGGENYWRELSDKAKLRHILRINERMNVQRRICDPLFAALDDAETDMARRQHLVEGFLATGCPLSFEYIRSNHHNVISLIQQLGRSE